MHRMIAPKPPIPLSGAPETFDKERETLHRKMLSSVSHDLKTPLASIIGALEVYERMKAQLTEEKQETLVKVALQEAYRLDSFITNILDMAKLDNNMVKAKQENAELGAIVRNSLLRLETRLAGSSVTILTSEPVDGLTDSVLLCRALCLVLDNAVKYGGSPASITVDYGMNTDGMGYIKVHDNGSGIPEDQREAVFSKYTRSIKEDQQNAGTGLGLAISRSTMTLLCGSITANNHEDGGAVFTLTFPFK